MHEDGQVERLCGFVNLVEVCVAEWNAIDVASYLNPDKSKLRLHAFQIPRRLLWTLKWRQSEATEAVRPSSNHRGDYRIDVIAHDTRVAFVEPLGEQLRQRR